MKKLFSWIAVMSLVLTCLVPCFTVTASAFSASDFSVAYDFSDLTQVDYGENYTHQIYDGSGGPSVSGMTASLVTETGGDKAVKFAATKDISSLVMSDHSGSRTANSSWPDATETPRGIVIKLSGGSKPVSFYMAFFLAVKGGVFKDASNNPIAAGTQYRFFPGNGTKDVARLYKADGTELTDTVNDRQGYNALVTVPANFDGYLVYEFKEMYLEGGNNLTPIDTDRPSTYYQKVALDDVQWFSSTFRFTYYFSGVEKDSSLTIDDYGYLNNKPVKAVPPNLNATVAYDFDNLSEVTYGSASPNMYWDGTGSALSASLVNRSGDKGVQFKVNANTASLTLRATVGGRSYGTWPAATESPKGIVMRVETGTKSVNFRIGFQLGIKGGVFNGIAAGTQYRFFPGINTSTIKLFDNNGTQNTSAVNDAAGYNSTVTVPANFKGWVVFEFTTLYLEGGSTLVPVNGVNRYDQKVNASDVQWFGDNFIFTYYFSNLEKDATLMIDDYGYLNGPTSAPLASDVIKGGNISATQLDTAWKLEKNSDDKVNGKIITYMGGYKNANGAAYLMTRSEETDKTSFFYQDIPMSQVYANKEYELAAYMRSYQINRNEANLPDDYGTYLCVQYLDAQGNILQSKTDYEAGKISFGRTDWTRYSLSFHPDAINGAATLRVGVMSKDIQHETAIDDVTLTYSGAQVPDYTDESATAPLPTVVTTNLPYGNGSAQSLFTPQQSIGAIPSPSPSIEPTPSLEATPSLEPTPSHEASPTATATDTTTVEPGGPALGSVGWTIIATALLAMGAVAFLVLKKKGGVQQ